MPHNVRCVTEKFKAAMLLCRVILRTRTAVSPLMCSRITGAQFIIMCILYDMFKSTPRCIISYIRNRMRAHRLRGNSQAYIGNEQRQRLTHLTLALRIALCAILLSFSCYLKRRRRGTLLATFTFFTETRHVLSLPSKSVVVIRRHKARRAGDYILATVADGARNGATILNS